MRIFPEMWAKTLWPFSSSTLNMAFGRGSVTVPSSTIASSFGFGRTSSWDGYNEVQGVVVGKLGVAGGIQGKNTDVRHFEPAGRRESVAARWGVKIRPGEGQALLTFGRWSST